MKKCIILWIIGALLLVNGCAPKDDFYQPPQNSTLIPVTPEQTPQPEQSEPEMQQQTPEQSPENPSEQTPEQPSSPTPNPTPEQSPEQTPEQSPEQTPEQPSQETPENNEESVDWTTSCMSFNAMIDRNPGTSFADPQVRAPWILDTIVKNNPDLLGMQEVSKTSSTGWDMHTYLVTELGKKGYDVSCLYDSVDKAQSKVTVDHNGSHLLIFWKKDRFELKDYGAMCYSNAPNAHYQWVKLFDKKENIEILMTNTHLPPTFISNGVPQWDESDKLRSVQAKELFNFWKKNCRNDMALYATGDYNADPTTNALLSLAAAQFISSNEISLNTNASSFYDHVYVNGDIQDCFKYQRCNETYEPKGEAKPDPDKRNERYCPSDHYAIIVYCSNAYR